MSIREELEQLPLRYRWFLRLLLRLPSPSFPYFVLKRLPEIEGFFWALGVPIILLLYLYFSVWFVTFLSLHVIFPFNLLLGLFIPSVVFVFFLRIEIERTIIWWKGIHSQTDEWDVSRRIEEFIELLKKQQTRK